MKFLRKSNKFVLFVILSILFIIILISIVGNNFFFNSDSEDFTFFESFITEDEEIIQEKVSTIAGKKYRKAIACLLEPSLTNSIDLLVDSEITENNNIFFIESSCSADGRTNLKPRQLCSVEAAAKMNPSMKIYLLILSNSGISPFTKNLITNLENYKNIFIRRVILDNYVKNTPIEDWWQRLAINSSKFPTEHMSDIIRALTLWKFPGIYLDLDVITLSSLENLRDFAGAEDETSVNNAIMSFGTSEIARRIVNIYVKNLNTEFRGDLWAFNGPQMLTKSILKICQAEKVADLKRNNCYGFKVFPPEKLYPIDWDRKLDFFRTKRKEETLKLINNSLTVHIWNKMSSNFPVKVGTQVPYGIIANKFCPNIYNNCGLWF